jgi:zinc transport system substrate-binding protein
MQIRSKRALLALSLVWAVSIPAYEATAAQKETHAHSHSDEKTIAKGYFKDEDVKPRTLADWQGEWQSLYPHL